MTDWPGVLARTEPRSLSAQDFGWHELNEPQCAACAIPIRIRGEAGVAVPMGPILFCLWTEGVWISHFFCRRHDWYCAAPTRDPRRRTLDDRGYVLMATDWWARQPDVAHYS